jgi:hypothetical protein
VDVQANSGGLHGAPHSIVVPDAHLLFAGDYKRAGLDLVLSKDGHDHVVQDYFKGHVRAALSSPDGARLSGALVDSLTGEVQVAQLSGATAAATVIGRVTKLTGSATAIRNGVSIQLNMGDNVNKGDVVQAGSDSSLGLTFIDGTVFGLSSNARMVLNEMVYDPNGSSNSSLLSLVQGTITFVAGETAKHGDMKVDTPVATMGIRGTAVLVEIDFTVPGTGGAPPVKFQVLVEPGGKTGSYVLYSKSNPNVVIGTVNQAGQVTSVVGDGTSSTAPAPLSPEALALIAPIFQLYFPNYMPNANPQGTNPNNGSAPANPTPGGSNPDPIKFTPPQDLPVGVPTTVPVNLPSDAPGTPPIVVTVTRFNTAPTIVVTPLAVTLQADGTGFKLTDRVTIIDPDIGDGVFNDVAVPYVAGTGRIVSAVGPANLPAGLDLTRLVTVDPLTGAVSYDPAAFRFLGEGQNAVFTISFDSRSGPDTVHETLTFTIEGVNDAPAITHAGLTVAEGGTVLLTAASIGVSDPDSSNFTFKVSGVSHGTFQTSTDGIHWTDATTFTTADLNAGHVRFVHDGGDAAPTFSITADDGAGANHLSNTLVGTVGFTAVNDAPVITRAGLTVAEGGTVLLTAASIGISDPDSSNFTFKVSGVSHGTFQTSTDGIHWTAATTFTTADLNAGHVRFIHDGGEAAPTFSITADDGAVANHLSNTLVGSVDFTNVNDAPVITSATLSVGNGGTVIVQLSDVGIFDPDSSSFTFYATATHGSFEFFTGESWVPITSADSVTSVDITAGHVRFHHDGSGIAPDITVVVGDGSAVSTPFDANVHFTAPTYHLSSSAGASIDVSPYGATSGFTLPGAGNVTTPGTPEDRIVLGYDLGTSHVVLQGAPMMGNTDFTPISSVQTHNADGSDSVATQLSAGNGVTLTQTVTLGADANFFTTTIDIFNNSGATIDNFRFMRNFDPDQDVDTYGTHYTNNDVIHNPAGVDDVAIVSAAGIYSHADVALIGLGGSWRASSYGFTNTDPYTTSAYDSPNDPGGASSDTAISLTNSFGSIANGQHGTVTYVTTNNVATEGSNALYGTEGADAINGQGGNDLLIGLGGADNFVFTASSGHDTIYDFQNSIDHIDLSAVVATNDISAWMAGHVAASPTGTADTLITLDGGDTILLHNVAYTSLHASDFIVQPHVA